jgi:hypothetical protein
VVGASRRGPSVPRAVLVERHARDRGNCRRLIDSAARVASLAWHADFDAIARVLALAIAAPRAIGMLLTDPSRVVANYARHEAKIGAGPGESESVRREAVVGYCLTC